MRKSLVAAIAAGVALLVLMVGAVSSAAGGTAEKKGTLVVVQRAPDQAFVDLGDPGPSPGDILEFKSLLFDEANSAQVGDVHIQCTQSLDDRAVCLGIFSFTGRGQISVDALPEFPLATVGMVTGGNGDFLDVRGEAHIDPQPDGTTMITFHLIGARGL